MHEFNTKNFYLTLLIFLIAAVAIVAQPSSEPAFNLGVKQLDQKNYDAAIGSFSECLKLEPKAYHCLQNRTIVYIAKAGNERVTPAEIVAADSVNIINETLKKALADTNRMIELSPTNGVGYALRAKVYASEKIYDKALADYRQSLAVDPNLAKSNPAVFSAVKIGVAKAEKELPFSIVVKGRRVDMKARELERLGDKAEALKLYPLAVEHFTAAIGLDKTQTEAFDDRGRVYKALGNYDAAVADFTEVVKISQANQFTGHYLGTYLYALNHRADVYVLQKKVPLALADYEKVLATPVSEQSSYPIQNARVSRGKLLLDSGNPAQAISDFDKILAETPKYAQVSYYRGLAHLKIGAKAKAVQDFNSALENKPDLQEARTELQKLGSTPAIGPTKVAPAAPTKLATPPIKSTVTTKTAAPATYPALIVENGQLPIPSNADKWIIIPGIEPKQYALPSLMQKEGNTRTLWLMTSYDDWASVMYIENRVDCAQQKAGLLRVMVMADGKQKTQSDERQSIKLGTIDPGPSTLRTIWKFVCSQ